MFLRIVIVRDNDHQSATFHAAGTLCDLGFFFLCILVLALLPYCKVRLHFLCELLFVFSGCVSALFPIPKTSEVDNRL